MRPPTEYDGARMPAEAEEGDPRAPAMMICARLAGRAIIRVVGRCEDAQENSQLVFLIPYYIYIDSRKTKCMRKARRHMDLLRVPYEYVLIVYTCEVIDLEHPRASTQ
ncbi:unnamed protein product [Euphydryas editha]|uniref:Uncharacterized protein n=1 Tax=Euphydryas editha TaxID=104508 RepID=A0AAU9UQU8_EUPED|nr:unnamed protein product [Euphydryas editha]